MFSFDELIHNIYTEISSKYSTGFLITGFENRDLYNLFFIYYSTYHEAISKSVTVHKKSLCVLPQRLLKKYMQLFIYFQQVPEQKSLKWNLWKELIFPE